MLRRQPRLLPAHLSGSSHLPRRTEGPHRRLPLAGMLRRKRRLLRAWHSSTLYTRRRLTLPHVLTRRRLLSRSHRSTQRASEG